MSNIVKLSVPGTLLLALQFLLGIKIIDIQYDIVIGCYWPLLRFIHNLQFTCKIQWNNNQSWSHVEIKSTCWCSRSRRILSLWGCPDTNEGSTLWTSLDTWWTQAKGAEFPLEVAGLLEREHPRDLETSSKSQQELMNCGQFKRAKITLSNQVSFLPN